MCAFNRLEGRPCCANSELEQDILRNKWKFEGIVVTDCHAINTFLPDHHNVDPDKPSAVADGIIHGII
jgi:beta-glucosidase